MERVAMKQPEGEIASCRQRGQEYSTKRENVKTRLGDAEIPPRAALWINQQFWAQTLERCALQLCLIFFLLISGQKYQNSSMPEMQGRPNKPAVNQKWKRGFLDISSSVEEGDFFFHFHRANSEIKMWFCFFSQLLPVNLGGVCQVGSGMKQKHVTARCMLSI